MVFFFFCASSLRLEGAVSILDMDSNVEEKLRLESKGGATGLNLKEDERIYFGGLPISGNYRYMSSFRHTFINVCNPKKTHSLIVVV